MNSRIDVINEAIKAIIHAINLETDHIKKNGNISQIKLNNKLTAIQSYSNNIMDMAVNGIEISQDTHKLIIQLHNIVIENIAILTAHKKVSELTLNSILACINSSNHTYNKPNKLNKPNKPNNIGKITYNEIH